MVAVLDKLWYEKEGEENNEDQGEENNEDQGEESNEDQEKSNKDKNDFGALDRYKKGSTCFQLIASAGHAEEVSTYFLFTNYK